MNSAELNGASLGDAFDSSTAVADPAASLPGAIIEVVEGSADFDEVNQAGGIWYEEAPSGTPVPYLVFHLIGDITRHTRGGPAKRTTYQFDIFTETREDGERLASALEATFTPYMDDVPFAGGVLLSGVPGVSSTDPDEYDNPDASSGLRVRRRMLDIAIWNDRDGPAAP